MFSLYLLFTSIVICPSWKVSRYGVFSGLYFPVFGLNNGKYGREETPYISEHRKCSVKKGVLKNFAKFTEKQFLKKDISTEHLWATASVRIWTLFIQCYLHSLVYTYLHLLIHTSVPLYYYTNLIKLIKYGKYRNYEEIF